MLFYSEGISKKTARLHEALDAERLKIAEHMHYKLLSCVEDDNQYYNTCHKNIYEFCCDSSVHKSIDAPKTLEHRFVYEDVGYGLTALSYLASLYSVDIPNINSIIQLFSTIMNHDFYRYGHRFEGLTMPIVQRLS